MTASLPKAWEQKDPGLKPGDLEPKNPGLKPGDKATRSKDMLIEARDHFFKVHRDIVPVIKALETLIASLQAFKATSGHLPSFSLGLAHYEYSLKRAIIFKDDAYETACSISALTRDGQDG